MSRPVYIVPPSQDGFSDEHDRSTRIALARLIAELIDGDFRGEIEGDRVSCGAYFVPADTLLVEEAHRLGVRSEADLYGGVVPHAFVATKAVSHPLVSSRAAAPEGWQSLGRDIGESVLRGFTAFSREDAEEAAEALLREGPLRLKPVTAVAGRGQVSAVDQEQVSQALDRQDWEKIARTGLALEEDVSEGTTYSVGQTRVGGLFVSYYGLQKETDDNAHETTYGGSVLTVVRGDYDALLALDVSDGARTAVAQARAFDAAVSRAYPQFFASRRNYDVMQGFDRDGRLRSGVLEQSWRLGGASGAELVALRELKRQPKLKHLKARTVELFGEAGEVPPGALILFQGVDPKIGQLSKYAVAQVEA